jgi:hypothetical protein
MLGADWFDSDLKLRMPVALPTPRAVPTAGSFQSDHHPRQAPQAYVEQLCHSGLLVD